MVLFLRIRKALADIQDWEESVSVNDQVDVACLFKKKLSRTGLRYEGFEFGHVDIVHELGEVKLRRGSVDKRNAEHG